MPDIDTPDPEAAPPTPAEIESWPSGRTPDELPATTPSPATPDSLDDPEYAQNPAELPHTGPEEMPRSDPSI